MKLSSKKEGIEIYNELFKNKTFCQPQNKHERPIIDSTIKEIKDKKTGETKKVEKNEYGTCKECGYPLTTVDHHRSERICECGITNKVVLINDEETKQQYRRKKIKTGSDNGYTEDERRFMKSRHKKLPPVRNTKQNWRKSQHIFALDNISSQLMMTKPQKDRVLEIMERHSLHMIHSRVDARTTIAGICRYILLKDGRGRELRYNKSAFKFVGLNKSNYAKIEHNLRRLGL